MAITLSGQGAGDVMHACFRPFKKIISPTGFIRIHLAYKKLRVLLHHHAGTDWIDGPPGLDDLIRSCLEISI